MITLGWDMLPIFLLIVLPITWYVLTTDEQELETNG